MNYNELTWRYFLSTPNAGVLAGPGVFRGSAGDRQQGNWVQFDVQAACGILEAVRFLAFACPHIIAVSAWLAEQALGNPLERELPLGVHDLRGRFAVPIEKLGRLLVVEDAWRATMAAAIDSGALDSGD